MAACPSLWLQLGGGLEAGADPPVSRRRSPGLRDGLAVAVGGEGMKQADSGSMGSRLVDHAEPFAPAI